MTPGSSQNGPRSRAALRLAPGVVISILSLAILFYFVDLNQFLDALRRANYAMVGLYFAISLVWLFMRTIVWRTLLQEKASLGQVFLTLNEGYLINNILPFRLGEVARAFLLSRKADLKFLEVFSTIVVERGLDVALAAGLLISTLPYIVEASWALQAAVVAGLLALVGFVLLFLLARNPEWTIRQFMRLTSRWSWLHKIGSTQLQAFLSGLAPLTDWKRFLKVICLMILNWSIAIVQYFFLLLAFFPEARMLWAAFSLGVLALGIAVPSSPGAVGVLELSMVAALSAFGLDPSISLAAAIIAHLTNYLITGVIGTFALVQDGLSLTGVYKEVQTVSSSETSDSSGQV